jgi:hypothetical protein
MSPHSTWIHAKSTEYQGDSKDLIIPKPGKPSYSTPKVLQLRVLLNTPGKLLEKMLSCCLQFDSVTHNVFHPNQFVGIVQCSMEDTGVYLTHLVCVGWVQGLQMSVVVFDIVQFFPLWNHSVLLWIIDRSGFPPCVGKFFWSYLMVS